MQTKPLLYGIIGFMLGGLVVSTAAVTIEKPADKQPTATVSMARTLEGKAGDDFDKAFITGMIGHHQDAINMAQMADDLAKHPEVKNLSKAIIDAQQKEIDQMKKWHADWGYGTLPSNHTSH